MPKRPTQSLFPSNGVECLILLASGQRIPLDPGLAPLYGLSDQEIALVEEATQ